MRNYEALFIIKAIADDDAKKVVEQVGETFKKNNITLVNEENWGKRAFPYLIKKEKEGYYYKVNFTSEPAAIAAIESTFGLNTQILRVTVVKKD